MSALPSRCDSPRTNSCATTTARVDATRPFTASAARSSRLLSVHVHCSEHLDALAATAPSSFVVASIGAFATPGDCITCYSSSSATEAAATRSISDDADGAAVADVLYTHRYSPFAATRVVERSSAPAWNELLVLALPFEHQGLALKLELVQRGASQQEDFLLATAVVPLQLIACHCEQVRLALQFPAAGAAPRLFVSLYESVRDCSAAAALTDRLEVLVEQFVPVAASAGPTELTAALAVGTSSDGLHAHEQLSQLFTLCEHTSHPCASSASPAGGSGVTPSASRQPRDSDDAEAAFAWHYPLVFELAPSSSSADPLEVAIALFDTTSEHPHLRVGSGHLTLPSHLRASAGTDSFGAVTALSRDARFAPSPPVPIYRETLADSSSRLLLGHVHMSVRWWSPGAWTAFARAAPSRRIVSSNRSVSKNRGLLALDWTGALLRGLNRYPVSSFCDEGGLSSVLAAFLAASAPSSAPTDNEHSSGAAAAGPVGDPSRDQVTAVLTAQLARLQSESAAQQQQIARLQTDLDARLHAVQTCGKELVALRREVRAKDQVISELRAERNATAARDREQLAQLAASAPSGSSDSRTQQQLALVLAKYAHLEQQHRDVSAQLEAAKRSLAHAQDVETRCTELEHAHLVQAAQVQKLQRATQHVAALQRTVRLQEKVIQQFEAAVRREATDERVAPAQARATASDTSGCSDALLAVRVRVLEQQLAMNAREAASELGRLRLRVLELEAAQRGQLDDGRGANERHRE